jgi:hypothetical protein
MYSPCLVFPYHSSFIQWYTFDDVLTHTLPGPPPAAAVVGIAESFDAFIGAADGEGAVLVVAVAPAAPIAPAPAAVPADLVGAVDSLVFAAFSAFVSFAALGVFSDGDAA